MGASQNNTGSQSGGAPSSQSGSHLGKKTNNTPNVYNEYSGVPWWLHGLRIRCCHCSGLRRCGGTASIPGPGTPTWHSREWGEEATLGHERIQVIHTEVWRKEKNHIWWISQVLAVAGKIHRPTQNQWVKVLRSKSLFSKSERSSPRYLSTTKTEK